MSNFFRHIQHRSIYSKTYDFITHTAFASHQKLLINNIIRFFLILRECSMAPFLHNNYMKHKSDNDENSEKPEFNMDVTQKHEIKKILVIEDEESVCQTLYKMLSRGNYYIETFTNSPEAVERFYEYPFDVVITDLKMPDLSGWQVAKKVKEKNPSIPVIMITGSTTMYLKKSLVDFGVDYVLNKPFHLEKILEIVSESLLLSK